MAETESIAAHPPPTGWDLFLSYRREDEKPVAALHATLTREGLRVFRDTAEIGPFDPITEPIRAHLLASKALLAWHGADYARSRPCQWELTLALLAARRFGENGPMERVFSIARKADLESLEPAELRDRIVFDLDCAARDPAAAAAKIVPRIKDLKQRFGDLPDPMPRVWHPAPLARSEPFVGRIAELWRVHALLQANPLVGVPRATGAALGAVQGLGGMGKTLLAREFACRYAADFPGGVFWLNAGGDPPPGEATPTPESRTDRRMAELQAVADQLGVGEDVRNENDLRGRLAQKLAGAGRFLWVIDDLPSTTEPGERDRWLAPAIRGCTLVTLRHGRLVGKNAMLQLEILPRHDAVALLRDAAPEGAAAELDALAAAIGDHPLALALLAAQLTTTPAAELLADFSNQPPLERLEQIRHAIGTYLPEGHESSIVRTFLRSLRRLEDDSLARPDDQAPVARAARELLVLAGGLGPAPIPRNAARAALPGLKVDDGILRLHTEGLVAVPTDDKKAFSVHTLVGAASLRMGWVEQELAQARVEAARDWLVDYIKTIMQTSGEGARPKVLPLLAHLTADTRQILESKLITAYTPSSADEPAARVMHRHLQEQEGRSCPSP